MAPLTALRERDARSDGSKPIEVRKPRTDFPLWTHHDKHGVIDPMTMHNTRNFITVLERDPHGFHPRQVICRECGAALPPTTINQVAAVNVGLGAVKPSPPHEGHPVVPARPVAHAELATVDSCVGSCPQVLFATSV